MIALRIVALLLLALAAARANAQCSAIPLASGTIVETEDSTSTQVHLCLPVFGADHDWHVWVDGVPTQSGTAPDGGIVHFDAPWGAQIEFCYRYHLHVVPPELDCYAFETVPFGFDADGDRTIGGDDFGNFRAMFAAGHAGYTGRTFQIFRDLLRTGDEAQQTETGRMIWRPGPMPWSAP